jgi:hypothetical protein
MRVSSRVWVLLLAACLSPAAYAAGVWPLSSNAKARQAGKTLHSAVQQTVRPLGNHLRPAKTAGSTRPMPKTILAKRPP